MSWTYNPAQLSTNSTYQVRLLIGDTVSTDPQFQDEEIAYTITTRGNQYGAAADLCRSLASRFARKADVMDQAMRTQFSSISRNYAAMAVLFTARAAGTVMPYGGGISIDDKIAQETDPDRNAPAFGVGMDDNTVPTPPAGNESGAGANPNPLTP